MKRLHLAVPSLLCNGVQPCSRRLVTRNLTTSASARAASRRLSLTEGASSPPLHNQTLPDFFATKILPHCGDKTALISRHDLKSRFGGPRQRSPVIHVHWTFEELDQRVAALSRGLLGLGIGKTDRVAVIMGNNSAYALLQWACARIGAILVTMNPAYRIHEIIRTLDSVQVKALAIVPQIRSSNYLGMLLSELPALTKPDFVIDEPALPSLKHLILVDNCSHVRDYSKALQIAPAAIAFDELLAWYRPVNLSPVTQQLDQHDVVNLQFTSGTTGLPKAVSLTHHNLLNNAWSVGACMALTSSDRVCNVPPLFHCFDEIEPSKLTSILPPFTRLVLGNLAAWTHGASIVYASEVFNPEAVVTALHEEQCTAVHGVPTHFLGVLDALKKDQKTGAVRDLSRLRTGIAAGSPIPVDLMHQLIEKLNLKDLTIAYGMTETSPVSFQTTLDDPLTKKVETVGKALPHVKAKIVDPETGEIVPTGEPGELHVSGYNVQKGYWQDPEQTAQVLKPDREGRLWMHTGDVAIMDEDGYLKIVGRIKDVIIRGGENLFPVQIENVLTSHPSINEAAAISVADPVYGEVVGAWIRRQDNAEPRLTKEQVRSWVATEMNPQNAPAWVWFLGEDGVEHELPKTASGKVQKNVLRDWSKTWAEKGIGRVQS